MKMTDKSIKTDQILLNAKQAGEYLCINLRTLQRLSKRGKIKSFKIGRQWHYIKTDIENYFINLEKGFLTARQVSKYLSIPLSTIYYLSKQGKIKSTKIGGQWRYLKEDIEKYITNNTVFSYEPIKKPNNFIERRANPRINTDLDCQYMINMPRFKVINNKGIIKNLSAGGVLAVCQDVEIKMGDPISLDFMDMSIEGRVVRKIVNDVGIKFKNICKESEKRIVEYVG